MMNLVRRSFRRRSMNMEMMKMAVWSPRLSMYLLRRPLSHTYDDKPRSRRSCCFGGGSIKARTSPVSTSGSPSFKDH
jgi:hypothetical protein